VDERRLVGAVESGWAISTVLYGPAGEKSDGAVFFTLGFLRAAFGEREVTAWVRDDTVGGVRSIFVRLVPRGEVPDLETWELPECHVDFDREGQPIGIQLFLFQDHQRVKSPKDTIIQPPAPGPARAARAPGAWARSQQ
jgi:hypothetical protein